MKIILASASPRRSDILTKFGFKFTVIKSDFNETNELENPCETAMGFALGKAKNVAENTLLDNDTIVLGADTVVYFENEILGKPKDKGQARAMLNRLSGNEHKVITGYALISKDKVVTGYDESSVVFNELPSSLINEYVETGLPLDKAGSYGLQDGFDIVKEYKGSYYNIVGLPIEKIIEELKNF